MTSDSQLKISYSRANAFKSCPMYFKMRYLDNEHSDKNEYAEAGILFHNAVEVDSNHHDPDIIEAAIRHKGARRDPKVTARALNALPAYSAFIKADPYSSSVLHREYEMHEVWTDPETGDEIRLHGFADRVCQGDKGLIIDDWKLGKQRPSDIAQLQTYAPIVARALGENVSLLRLIYLQQNGGFKVKSFKPKMTYDQVIDYLTDMAQMLYRTGYYPAWGATTGHCRVCPFTDRCDWVRLSSDSAL